MQTEVLDKIRSRVCRYLGEVRSGEIDIDAPVALVRAPVEAGLSKFIDVANIPKLDDLPFIPERMRDFSFRYATEYLPVKQWAREYNCTEETIQKWLRHEGVRAYIAVCRYEQRMYNLAQHVTMQKNVYKAINSILNTKITADTIGPMVSLSKFVYMILHNPQGANDSEKGTLNLNIGIGSMQTPAGSPYSSVDNPYALAERDVTPKKLSELQSDLEELNILYKVLGEEGSKNER